MSQNPWYRIAIVAVLAVAVVIVLSGRKPATESPAAEAGSSPTQMAADTAAPAKPAGTERKLPRLLDLGGETCVVCQQMAPILDDVKREQAGRIDVEFVDVWKDQAMGEKYGIKLIPTQIFFDSEGKEFFRHEGFFPKEEILKVFRKHGIEPAKSKAKG